MNACAFAVPHRVSRRHQLGDHEGHARPKFGSLTVAVGEVLINALLENGRSINSKQPDHLASDVEDIISIRHAHYNLKVAKVEPNATNYACNRPRSILLNPDLSRKCL